MTPPRPATPRWTPGAVALHAALALLALLTLAPLAWMVSASLMPTGEAAAFPPRLLPSAPTLEHYRLLVTRLNVGRYALNSALLATVVTVLSTAVNAAAGYAFAKFRFRGRDPLFRALLAALVVPAQVAMLPLFLLLKQMGLINTYAGIVVPGLASVFGIFLVRQFAVSLPDDLLDAARVDGASEAWLFFRVVVPLLKPVLVTLALFTFMGVWNDFMWPLIVLTDDRLYTLPVALANLLGEHAQDPELMMAGAVLTVAPVLVLFLALQKVYVDGIMLGGVKG